MDFAAWASAYREEANLDGYQHAAAERERAHFAVGATLDEHLIVGTMHFVFWHTVYRGMENSKLDPSDFLRKQVYDDTKSEAEYRLVFERGKHLYSRLLVDSLAEVDLVDLHDASGFSHLSIQRLDGRRMTAKEHRALEEGVRDDFYFDYAKDEIEFRLERSPKSLEVYGVHEAT